MADFYFDFSKDFYFPNKIKKDRHKAKTLNRLLGRDEHGVLCFPKKMSNAKAALLTEKDKLYCNYCTPNNGCNAIHRRKKRGRNWKMLRRTQWKNFNST